MRSKKSIPSWTDNSAPIPLIHFDLSGSSAFSTSFTSTEAFTNSSLLISCLLLLPFDAFQLQSWDLEANIWDRLDCQQLHHLLRSLQLQATARRSLNLQHRTAWPRATSGYQAKEACWKRLLSNCPKQGFFFHLHSANMIVTHSAERVVEGDLRTSSSSGSNIATRGVTCLRTSTRPTFTQASGPFPASPTRFAWWAAISIHEHSTLLVGTCMSLSSVGASYECTNCSILASRAPQAFPNKLCNIRRAWWWSAFLKSKNGASMWGWSPTLETQTTLFDWVGWVCIRHRFRSADLHFFGPETRTRLVACPSRTATTAPSGIVSSMPTKTPYFTFGTKSPPSRTACSLAGTTTQSPGAGNFEGNALAKALWRNKKQACGRTCAHIVTGSRPSWSNATVFCLTMPTYLSARPFCALSPGWEVVCRTPISCMAVRNKLDANSPPQSLCTWARGSFPPNNDRKMLRTCLAAVRTFADALSTTGTP